MPVLSVVVPVYNVEDYLERCLDSLRIQTFEDIEILCVNDGSTDGSRQVLIACQENDPRIKIIDKENGGLSSARNAGIKAATTNIVCFLDSDDRFTPDACGVIVNTFNKTNADVVTFGAYCYPESAGYPWLIEHLSPRDAEYEPFHPDLLFKEMSRPFAWRTACKKAFLQNNSIEFIENLKFGEDQVFHFSIYPRAGKTVLISNKLYEYRVFREGSLMHKVTHDLYTKCREHIKIVDCILEDWKQGGLLEQYPNQLADWLVDFVLNEAMGLEPTQAKEVFSSVGSIWTSYKELLQPKDIDLPAATKNVLNLIMDPEKITVLTLKKCRLLYFRERYGTKAMVRKLL